MKKLIEEIKDYCKIYCKHCDHNKCKCCIVGDIKEIIKKYER